VFSTEASTSLTGAVQLSPSPPPSPPPSPQPPSPPSPSPPLPPRPPTPPPRPPLPPSGTFVSVPKGGYAVASCSSGQNIDTIISPVWVSSLTFLQQRRQRQGQQLDGCYWLNKMCRLPELCRDT